MLATAFSSLITPLMLYTRQSRRVLALSHRLGCEDLISSGKAGVSDLQNSLIYC